MLTNIKLSTQSTSKFKTKPGTKTNNNPKPMQILYQIVTPDTETKSDSEHDHKQI